MTFISQRSIEQRLHIDLILDPKESNGDEGKDVIKGLTQKGIRP